MKKVKKKNILNLRKHVPYQLDDFPSEERFWHPTPTFPVNTGSEQIGRNDVEVGDDQINGMVFLLKSDSG